MMGILFYSSGIYILAMARRVIQFSISVYIASMVLTTWFISNSCYSLDIVADVRPLRMVYINRLDQIVAIESNTNNAVEPTFMRMGSTNTNIKLYKSTQNEYNAIIQKYDFSRPTTITIRHLNSYDMILNLLTNVCSY